LDRFTAERFSFSLRGVHWGPWDFSFPAQGIVGVVGPNGAGKTSLFHALLGYPAAMTGALSFGERSLLAVSPVERRELWAAVPQESPYPEDWTVEAAIQLAFLKTKGLVSQLTSEEKLAVTHALVSMGLSEIKDRRLGQLSSGQRQRVFLCRALLQRAKGLLLDEPTNHLDPPARRTFWQQLEALRRESGSPLVLVATHEVERLQESADHILALSSAGRLVYAGPAEAYWRLDWFSLTFS